MGRAWRDRTVALTRAWALTGGAAGPVPHGCRRGRPTLRDTSGGAPALQPSSASAVCLRLMATAVVAASSCSAAAQELRNWFDDPFFQLTAAVAACPEPAGPRSTEAERLAQSHHRVEKGVSCWLARQPDCPSPSAYAHDHDIAAQIRAAAPAEAALAQTTLWVTVQGRIVYVEGCVTAATQAEAIEAFIRRLPQVQRVVAIVSSTPGARPPYRLFAPAKKPARTPR